MKSARYRALVLAVSSAILFLTATWPHPVAASSSQGQEAASVIVEIVVHEPSGETRSYELLTTTDGSTRRLSTGSRVALQVKQPASVKEAVPLSTVQYQDIGFSAEVSVSRALDGELRVRARIEDSVVNEEAGGVLPQIDHHTQELQAIVPLDETVDATHVRGGEVRDYRVSLQLRSELR